MYNIYIYTYIYVCIYIYFVFENVLSILQTRTSFLESSTFSYLSESVHITYYVYSGNLISRRIIYLSFLLVCLTVVYLYFSWYTCFLLIVSFFEIDTSLLLLTGSLNTSEIKKILLFIEYAIVTSEYFGFAFLPVINNSCPFPSCFYFASFYFNVL